jgi:hypothetical protein
MTGIPETLDNYFTYFSILFNRKKVVRQIYSESDIHPARNGATGHFHDFMNKAELKLFNFAFKILQEFRVPRNLIQKHSKSLFL